MSYDVGLLVDGVVAKVDNHQEGGSYVLGGSGSAELNITYNYAEIYQLVPALLGGRPETEVWHSTAEKEERFGIRWLDGRTAAETLPILEKAVEVLGTNRFSDYWAPTPGNAGYALSILVCWSKQYPNGVWVVR